MRAFLTSYNMNKAFSAAASFNAGADFACSENTDSMNIASFVDTFAVSIFVALISVLVLNISVISVAVVGIIKVVVTGQLNKRRLIRSIV